MWYYEADATDASPRDLVNIATINQMRKEIGVEKHKYAKVEGDSVDLKVAELAADGEIACYKSVRMPSPPGSGLPEDIFFLAIQTKTQKQFAKKYQRMFFVDGTHNCTQYVQMNLFTFIVKDTHGHGEFESLLLLLFQLLLYNLAAIMAWCQLLVGLPIRQRSASGCCCRYRTSRSEAEHQVQ